MPAPTFFAILLSLIAALSVLPAAAAPTPPRPLLWQVSDSDNAVYLLGSFHLLKPEDYPVSSDVDAAFADAERLVFELSPEALDAPDLPQRFLAAAGYDNDARSLDDVLPAHLDTRLAQVLKRGGRSIEQLDGFEPWYINLALMMGVSQSLGFKAELGLDRRLMARAAEAGKPASGLETMDDQLHALDAAPMGEQIAGLAEFLDHRQEMPELLGDLHEAWRGADLARLDELTRQEMREKTPQTYRIINVERNQAWLPKLQALLDESASDDTLVVVGALHLLGDDGLVELLRERGYTVERICTACDPPL